MLSFKKGEPIAKIIGEGPYAGKTLYLAPNPLSRAGNSSISDKLNKKMARLSDWENEALKEAITNQDPSNLNDKLENIYNFATEEGELGKELKLPYPHQVQPIPNSKGRECYYIAGPSGSGKSTYVSKYISLWRKMFPNAEKHPLVLFSRVSEDECLDKFKPMRIRIDEGLKEDPVELDELADSLVIFDDVDQISNKNKLKDYVIGLRDQILEEGRHKNIYCCTTSHQMTNYKATRIPLTEASHCVFFPGCGAAHAIRYFLQTYIGLDKDQMSKIMDLPSRWVCLKKTYPMLVMHESGAYLL